MSPSPELSPQPSKPAAATNPLPADQQVSEKSKPSINSETTPAPTPPPPQGSQENAPTLHRPPMRPVRPQPVAEPAKAPTPPPATAKQASISVPVARSTVQPTPEEQAVEAVLRQQPIPPPSEPKQYRAIGVVRGRYTSSQEEFTRGTLVTPDSVVYNAVLLGRVMSLVRNHIDLEKDHLWVVYPRTREGEKELHMQIVGVWEPETLKRQPDELAEAGSTASETSAVEEVTDPGVEDGYFSIRGEVVFHSPEEQNTVVKIQQAPRKSSQKAKSFKLSLHGVLDSPKTLGYFWDLNVKLQNNALVIQDGTCVGLPPPKKRSKEMGSRGTRPRKPMGSGGRSVAGRGAGRPSGSPRPVSRREAAAKPVKRSEPSGEG
ncbi:hypothetical protein [Leptodesmis sp.]|uniref:hypothetical protein n=1 Tax=Leptodesmis sp. TaxID=3100501 RepID=UPI004053480F